MGQALVYCVIYCRISQDREGAHLGADRQEEDCRELAARLGLIVLAVYVDNDISAYHSRKPRAGYLRMLADARAGRLGAIIAWHTDRLHRSPLELEEYIAVCDPRDIPTYTVKAGNLDLSTPAGRLFARNMGNVARYQSEHMSEQITRKRQQLVESGKSPGGPRPFGFEKDGLTTRRSEADEIARLVRAAAGGTSLASLVKDLNERGITTAMGNEWTIQKLRVMLVRPRNAGILLYQGKEAGEAPWAPIADELTWRKMCLLFKDPARRTTMNHRVSSLGSGLYRCGKCGATMHISTSGAGSKVRGYRCAKHNHLTQAAAPLDEYVIRRLSELIRRPEYLSAVIEAMQDSPGRPDEGRIEAANARLAELGEMFAAGEIDARTLKAATERLRGQIAEAEQVIVKTALPWDSILESMQRMQRNPEESFRGMDLDQQRTLLGWAARVTVLPAAVKGGRFDPGRVRFDWSDTAAEMMETARLFPVRLPDGTIGYVSRRVL